MSNSSSGGLFGRQHTGSVTLVDQPVRVQFQRKAQLTFWIVAIVTGLISATVLSHVWHPLLGLLAGAVIGFVLGLLVASVVLIWPLLRALWWWADLITAGLVVFLGWPALANATNVPVSLVVLVVLVGVPAAVPAIRHRVVAIVWCFAVRHRLRTAFAPMVRSGGHGRAGSLPLIGMAWPTPAGERVTILLRPGLTYADLERQLGALAETCRADQVRVSRASQSNAARVRIDISRRDPLTALVINPLAGVGRGTGFDPTIVPLSPGMPPVGLDLPDVPEPADPERPTGRVPRPRPNGNGSNANGGNGSSPSGRSLPDDPNDAFI
ncbi:MAG: hypothetical protein HOV77_32035 [Hamadaea sp.]|uniref:hypothetical protein n=1 Tax=Hamadaea sp. TaxID=2024425 RepID=UPI0017E18E44|nr:hypothetical protein [Hamadaea sp.]NUT23818.1 hypothetical protein [Hamadaea sp.]